MGYFPVCGWLRLGTVFIKRQASILTTGRYDKVEDAFLNGMIAEMIARISEMDPIGVDWGMNGYMKKV